MVVVNIKGKTCAWFLVTAHFFDLFNHKCASLVSFTYKSPCYPNNHTYCNNNKSKPSHQSIFNFHLDEHNLFETMLKQFQPKNTAEQSTSWGLKTQAVKVFRPQEVDCCIFLGWNSLDIISKSSSSRLKSKRHDGGQFSLLGTGRLVAMTFLRRTSRPRQLLTDKQHLTKAKHDFRN